MNYDSPNNSIHNFISPAEKNSRKKKSSRHYRKCTGRSLKVRRLRQLAKEYIEKQKALKEADHRVKHDVQEVLHKILQNVAQNLNPVQQASNVLNDPVQRTLQDTATSDVTFTVSPEMNVSDIASSVSQVINFPQVATTSIVKDICALPIADNAIRSSCTKQTVSYNQRSTSSLVSSVGTSTLPVVVCPIQGSSGMRIISNYDSSTLSSVGTNDRKAQRISKSCADQKVSCLTKEVHLPLVSTACQTTQKDLQFFGKQKISGVNRQVIKQVTIHGRRIINFDYFFNALKDVNKHSASGCSLNDMIITSEETSGIYTIFILKCTVCGFQTTIYSEDPSAKKNVNADFIAGMMSIKASLGTANKFLRRLNLPLFAQFFFKEWEQILLSKRKNYKEIVSMLKKGFDATTEGCNFPTARKTSIISKTKLKLRPQTAPNQTSGLPEKTCQKPEKEIAQKESLFQNVHLSDLLVEEQIEIKEEINDNIHENDSEAIIPPETVMKTCEDKLINVKEQESINMTIIKQEINSDVDEEDLIGSKTCEIETLDKESSIEHDDQSKQMLQLKKVRTCEDKMTVNQEQVKVNKFPVIENRVVVNQEDIKLGVKGTKQKFYSVLGCEQLAKPRKVKNKKGTKQKCYSVIGRERLPKPRKVKNKKGAKQKLYSVIGYERLAKPRKIKNKKRVVQINSSETNRLVTATSSTLDGKNVFLIPLQYMPKVKENSVRGPHTSPNLANGPHDGISRAAFIPVTSTIFQQQTGESNSLLLPLLSKDSPSVYNCSTSGQNPLIIFPGTHKATYIVHAPPVIQQPTNLSNNGPVPSTSDDSKLIEQENNNPSFILPDGVPKDVSDPISPEPHIYQYNY